MHYLSCLLVVVAFFAPEGHAMILTGQSSPEVAMSLIDSIELTDRLLTAEPLLMLSASTLAVTSLGANVTVHVKQLSDGYSNASACDSSQTGLSTCNLRSAWAFCVKFITKSQSLCTETLSVEIVLPGGSNSFLQYQYGGSLKVGDYSRNSTCPIVLSITSSNTSRAMIQGENSNTGFLEVGPDQSVSGVKRLFLSYLLIYNFGANISAIISLKSVTSVMLDHVTMRSNRGAGYAVLSINQAKEIDFDNCIFEDNFSSGVSIVASTNVLFNQCSFSNNTASNNIGRTVTVNNTRNFIVRESAFKTGGAFSISHGSNIAFSTCVFTRNNASHSSGGAVSLLQSQNASFVNCKFLSNWAQSGGGMFLTNTTEIEVKNCTFESNQANVNGGAICSKQAKGLVFVDCKLSGNIATYGGAIQLSDTSGRTHSVSNSSFIDNHSFFGGAMHALVRLYLRGCYFGTNSALQGGAAYLITGSEITDSNFISNNATTRANPYAKLASGGALYIVGSTYVYMKISGSIFKDNKSKLKGGAISAYSVSNITITKSSFLNNYAYTDGGGIYFENFCTGLSISLTNFTHNTALSNGGGIFFSNAITFVNIFSSAFNSNKALTGSGGALYFTGTSSAVSIGGLMPKSISKPATGVSIPGATGYYVVFNSSSKLLGDVFLNSASIKGQNPSQNFTSIGLGQDVNKYPGNDGYAPQYFSGNYLKYFITENGYSFLFTIFPVFGKDFPTIFHGNSARVSAGAIYLGPKNANVFIMPWTLFSENSATQGTGGALYFKISNGLIYVYSANFTGNTASTGGAITFSQLNYPLLLSGCLFMNNSASGSGGAMYFGDANGFGFDKGFTRKALIFYKTSMYENSAALSGGAVYLSKLNSVVFNQTTLDGNYAGIDGGAMYADSQNSVKMIDSTFSRNSAVRYGGSFASYSANIIALRGQSVHYANHAKSAGGSVYTSFNSTVDIYDDAHFSLNSASNGHGGAISMHQYSNMSVWGTATFNENNASTLGGAIYSTSSTLYLGNKDIIFANNSAGQGSALRLEAMTSDSIRISTSLNTSVTYSNNHCTKRGGTVSWVKNPSTNSGVYSLTNASYSNRIKYHNNKAISGNFSSTQATHLLIPAESISVERYYSDVLPHPTFSLLDYYCQNDVTDSTTIVTASILNYSCSGHVGYLSGTISEVAINGSVVFSKLLAFCYPGGNLTLQYTARLQGFGTTYDISTVGTLRFRQCIDGEVLKDNQCQTCVNGSYSLHYDTSARCEPCPFNTDGCYGATILMSPGYWGINHYAVTPLSCPYGDASCPGGQMNSTTLLPVRIGTGQCAVGYEGPLCAICSPNYYFAQETTTCNPCSDQGPAQLATMIAVPLALLLFIVYFTFSNFLVKDDAVKVSIPDTDLIPPPLPIRAPMPTGLSQVFSTIVEQEIEIIKGWKQRMKEWMEEVVKIITPKVKIMLTVFQIISGFPYSLDLQFTAAANRIFGAFSVFNFSAIPHGSPQCYAKYDYVDKLILQTTVPIFLTFFLVISCAVHLLSVRKSKISNTSRIITRYITLFFLLTYFVLPSVTTTIFGAFVCQTVDPNNVAPGTPKYMRNDLSISCSSKRYSLGYYWAVAMILVYPIGISSMYTYVLHYNREAIMNKKSKNEKIEILEEEDNKIISAAKDKDNGTQASGFMRHITPDEIYFLHKAYKGRCWYWEVVETARRLMLTAVISVVATGTSAQIIWGVVIAVIYIKLYSFFRPFKKLDDDVLQELAQYQIFITLFISLVIRSNSLPGQFWSRFIDVVLVIVNISTSGFFLGSVFVAKDLIHDRYQTKMLKKGSVENHNEPDEEQVI